MRFMPSFDLDRRPCMNARMVSLMLLKNARTGFPDRYLGLDRPALASRTQTNCRLKSRKGPGMTPRPSDSVPDSQTLI